jgi:hypothetical protein
MVDQARRTLLALALLSLTVIPARAQGDVNVIESIRTVQTTSPAGTIDIIEITVSSSRDFPVGALPNVMRFVTPSGDREYGISRSPDTGADAGTLKKLVFSIPGAEFAQIPDGAPVFLQYGTGDGARDLRAFGNLNKNQLDR